MVTKYNYCRNGSRKGQCTLRKPHSSCQVLGHWRISEVKGQKKGHQQPLSPPMMLLNKVKVKLLQEEGAGAGQGRSSSTLKQMTLDSSLGFRHSERSASVAATAAVRNLADDEDNVESSSSDEAGKYGINEVDDSSENDENLQGKGRKRAAPRGRGRGATTSSKRGRKSDSTSIQRMLMNKDDDDDDEDDMSKRLNKPQPRVSYIHLSNKELWCSKKRQIDVDMYITHLKLYAHLLHIVVGGCCTVDKTEVGCSCFRVLHCAHHSNGHWKLNYLTVLSLRDQPQPNFGTTLHASEFKYSDRGMKKYKHYNRLEGLYTKDVSGKAGTGVEHFTKTVGGNGSPGQRKIASYSNQSLPSD
ncbi:Double-strand break repair protein MRE11 [Vitis vinifera]|uniref:Double-strand break repair protein MRE11 n=1 Tax=Vitis vinifera TaxID=29760 RepID=A0A438I8P4_VITVI|nr:Double-strand break repair protein MRE11 [Vitis vinifera]